MVFQPISVQETLNAFNLSVCACLLSSVIINGNFIWLQWDKEGYISMATTPQACKHAPTHPHTLPAGLDWALVNEWMWDLDQRCSMHRSYQPLKPVTNRYLQQRWDQNNYENHRRKVGGWRWRWSTAALLEMKTGGAAAGLEGWRIS